MGRSEPAFLSACNSVDFPQPFGPVTIMIAGNASHPANAMFLSFRISNLGMFTGCFFSPCLVDLLDALKRWPSACGKSSVNSRSGSSPSWWAHTAQGSDENGSRAPTPERDIQSRLPRASTYSVPSRSDSAQHPRRQALQATRKTSCHQY